VVALLTSLEGYERVGCGKRSQGFVVVDVNPCIIAVDCQQAIRKLLILSQLWEDRRSSSRLKWNRPAPEHQEQEEVSSIFPSRRNVQQLQPRQQQIDMRCFLMYTDRSPIGPQEVNMEFVSIRDLRLKPAEVWKKLRQQREVILTSNGRPMAVIAGVGENDVEETLMALRRARAQTAVSNLRRAAADQGLDKLSSAEIESEIAQTHQERRTALAKE
jgi:antitoxin (DNA-binding transcriptional repressor) of toxin-antitoxin stability system